MTVALALLILIANSHPVETIAGEAGVPRPQADRQRVPPVEPAKEPKPDPAATAGEPIAHSVPPDPSLILLTDIE